MRGFDALRALLGYEYSVGSWFRVPGHEVRAQRGGRPFGGGKDRPVILVTPLGPEAVLFPRSTKRGGSEQGARFEHGAHRHETGPCDIDRPGWVILAVPVAVDQSLLNDESYSCEEPDDSPLLDAMREAWRP